MPFLYGLLSFLSLVVGILAFSRERWVIGWIAIAAFAGFMIATYLTL